MHRLKIKKKLLIKEIEVNDYDNSYNNIYKKLNLFDTKIYKKMYDDKGYSYALSFISNGGIKDLIENNNKLECDSTENDLIICIPKENGEYERIYPDPKKIKKIHTMIEVIDNKLVNYKCNCSYQSKHKEGYCKHILALLIYKTGFINIKPMIELYEEYKNDILEKKDYVINYINTHKRYYKKIDPTNIDNVCGDIYNKIESTDKSIEKSIKNKNERNIFYSLHGFIKSYYNYIKDLEGLLNKIDYKEFGRAIDSFKPSEKRNGSGLGTLLGIFSGLYDYAIKEESKENKSGYTEAELNCYGLSESEKEEVYEGDFEPWDFEDDETYDKADDYDEH